MNKKTLIKDNTSLLLLIKITGLAALYFIFAKVGLSFAMATPQVSAVWPPTGIALAALLLMGCRAWPGITIGAFLINFSSNEPWITALSISLGNTLEAIAALYILRTLNFNKSFPQLKDYGAFVVAIIIGAILGAFVGVSSLYFGNLIINSNFIFTLITWFLGDVMGALILVPVFLQVPHIYKCLKNRDYPDIATIAEFALLLCLAIIIGGLAFFTHEPFIRNGYFPEYLMFPILIWASIRFYRTGASFIVLIFTILGIAGTINGYDPLGRIGDNIEGGFLAVQYVMGIVAITSMTLAITTDEREAAKRDIEKLIETLKKEIDAKDTLLATLSHELRNPLAPINSTLELIRLKNLLKDRELSELFEILERQTKHLTSLLKDLIDISRITRGKVDLRKEKVSLEEVVMNAVETAGPLITKGEHQLTIDLPEKNIYLNADSLRLAQIISNLLNNAAKYTKPKGKINITAYEDGAETVIKISDNGIGITPDIMPHLFQPFKQERQKESLFKGGLGIGLSIAKGLAELHGGSIVARSEGYNKGSEFEVRIPT